MRKASNPRRSRKGVEIAPRCVLPPSKATTQLWEADIRAAEFGNGIDWARVAKSMDARDRSCCLIPRAYRWLVTMYATSGAWPDLFCEPTERRSPWLRRNQGAGPQRVVKG
jgi:hypothetical protein